MKLKDLFAKVGSIGSSWDYDDRVPDDVTRDRRLRSLRRYKRELVDEPAERRYLEAAVREELLRRDRLFLDDGVRFGGGRNILTPVGKKVARVRRR